MLTPHHQKLRSGRITSSLIYWVVETPHKAWRILNGLDGDVFEQEAVDIGNAFEKPIMQIAAKRLGLAVRKAPFRAHSVHDWMGDSCDAAFYAPEGDQPFRDWSKHIRAIGEIKAAGAYVAAQYGDEGTDEVPERVFYQSHWHLMHWPEVDTCHAAAFLGGGPLRIKLYPIKRDDEIAGNLTAIAEKFYRDWVVTGREPPPDWHDSTAEYFKKKHPSGNGVMLEASQELIGCAMERQKLTQVAKELDKRIAEQTNRIRAIIGDNAGAVVNDKKLVSISDVAEAEIEATTRKAYRRIYISDKTLKELGQ
jgi:hypothetical protein